VNKNLHIGQRAKWTAKWIPGIFLGLLIGGIALAQDQSPQLSVSAATAEKQAEPDQHPGFSRELVRESRAAAGEDENAQFKQSGSVKKVAAITGLSLEHAYWLCLILNFAVVAGLIVWASKKYLPAAFRNRTAQIQQAMEEARVASAEANRRLAEINKRLGQLDTEINAMRNAGEKEAAAEEARVRAAAEEDAHKIMQAAEQEIAAATKAARRELTAYAASLAVSLAARQIHVDSAADEALVRDFARQLSRGENGREDGN
jgi:F-type H+-transporting ATPase subunit b